VDKTKGHKHAFMDEANFILSSEKFLNRIFLKREIPKK
jgi:hypothetical protein